MKLTFLSLSLLTIVSISFGQKIKSSKLIDYSYQYSENKPKFDKRYTITIDDLGVINYCVKSFNDTLVYETVVLTNSETEEINNYINKLSAKDIKKLKFDKKQTNYQEIVIKKNLKSINVKWNNKSTRKIKKLVDFIRKITLDKVLYTKLGVATDDFVKYNGFISIAEKNDIENLEYYSVLKNYLRKESIAIFGKELSIYDFNTTLERDIHHFEYIYVELISKKETALYIGSNYLNSENSTSDLNTENNPNSVIFVYDKWAKKITNHISKMPSYLTKTFPTTDCYAYVLDGFSAKGLDRKGHVNVETYLVLDFVDIIYNKETNQHEIINQTIKNDTVMFVTDFLNCDKSKEISQINKIDYRYKATDTLFKVKIQGGILKEFYKDDCHNISLSSKFTYPSAIEIKFNEYRNFLTPELIESLPERVHSDIFKKYNIDSIDVKVVYFKPSNKKYDYAFAQVNSYRKSKLGSAFILFYPDENGNLVYTQYSILNKQELPCDDCELINIITTPSNRTLGYFHNTSNPELKMIKELKIHPIKMITTWSDFKY